MTIRPELIDELLKECSDPREVLAVRPLDCLLVHLFLSHVLSLSSCFLSNPPFSSSTSGWTVVLPPRKKCFYRTLENSSSGPQMVWTGASAARPEGRSYKGCSKICTR